MKAQELLATLRDETRQIEETPQQEFNTYLSEFSIKAVLHRSFNSERCMQSRPVSNVSVQWSSHSRWPNKYFNKYFVSITNLKLEVRLPKGTSE